MVDFVLICELEDPKERVRIKERRDCKGYERES
jgi:hypothetical protein